MGGPGSGRRKGSSGRNNNSKLSSMNKNKVSNLQRFRASAKSFNSSKSSRIGKGNKEAIGSKRGLRVSKQKVGTKNYGKAYMSDKK